MYLMRAYLAGLVSSKQQGKPYAVRRVMYYTLRELDYTHAEAAKECNKIKSYKIPTGSTLQDEIINRLKQIRESQDEK